MEKAKEFLKPNSVELERVFSDGSDLHVTRGKHCFYEDFALRGIQVDRFETGSVACTFKVPPRLTDRNGNMAPGAIFNLVDEVGAAAAVQFEGQPMLVSVDMSVSFLSTAKVDVRRTRNHGKAIRPKGQMLGNSCPPPEQDYQRGCS
ncbi:unnamed protein product [Rhodiola kirilowii]